MTTRKTLPLVVLDNMVEFFRRRHVEHDIYRQNFEKLGFPGDMGSTIDLGLAVSQGGVLGRYVLTPKGESVLDAYLEAGLNKDSFSGFDIKDSGLYKKIFYLEFDI